MVKNDIKQIKSRLIRGDIYKISKKTGYTPSHVGKFLLGLYEITANNECIIKAALEIIEEREKINQRANELLNQ